MADFNFTTARHTDTTADNTKVLVLAGHVKLFGWTIYNPDSTNEAFLQLFDSATTAAVNLGTTVPVFSLRIGPNSQVYLKNARDEAEQFALGLVYAATSTVGGSTAPSTDLNLVLEYR